MERSLQSYLGKDQAVNKNNTKKETLWLLNVMRGVSALLIVFYHYTTQYDNSIGHLVKYSVTVPWGCYAVYTFFMLSGFLTVYSCKEDTNAVGFMKKRFFRLYPMFWICMTVTSLYMLVIMPERVPSLKQFLLNLTMMPSLLGVKAVDGVYWTLAKELFFYLGFAVILQLGFFKKDKTNWLWGWLCLSVFAAGYCYGPYHLPVRGVSLLLMPEYIYAFLAGCAVYYFNRENRVKKKVKMLIYMMICIAMCFLMKSGAIAVFFTVSLCILIVCAQDSVNIKTLPMKRAFAPVLFVSEISYLLYLTHQFIGFGIIRMMENHGMVAEAWILVPFFHAIFLATILHYGIELRLNHLLGKLSR